MKKIMSPIMTSIIILFLLSWLKDNFIYVLFPIIIYLSLLFHELGHVVFGLIKKASFQEIVVGPLSYKRQKGLNWNREWGKFGGLTIMQLTPDNKYQHIAYYAGGPLASATLNVLFMFSKVDLLMLTASLNFVILLVTILPYNIKGLSSDGYIIYQYLKNNERFIYFNSISTFLIFPFNKETNRKIIKKLPDFANVNNLSDQEEAIAFLYEMYNLILFKKPFEFKFYQNYLVDTTPFSEIINSNLQILDYINIHLNKRYRKVKNINFLDKITKNKLLLIKCKKEDENYYINVLKDELNILKDTDSLTYKGENKIIELILLKKEEYY